MRRGFPLAAAALAAALAGAWLVDIDRRSDSRARVLPDQVMTLLATPRPVTDFTLTDDRNRVFDLARLKGKWSFVFFGFTHCPDVCPTSLAALAGARARIERSAAGAADIQFVFVSVDPNRDTPGKLGPYVRAFDASFVGVTGDDAQIANLAGQLGAFYEVAMTPGADDYPVSHSAAVFLLDPRARQHAVFAPPLDAQAISERFEVVRELAGNAYFERATM